MKELEFISIIRQSLTNSSHIGDDCAYLKELGIVITHDSLVEEVHFTRKFSTAYQIGYKSIMVNLSDIFASGGMPKYLTISLSLPKNTDEAFVREFYRACEDLSKEFDFEVVGGDITGSEKIFISVCAIGITANRNISSRKNAKADDLVIATGTHGSSEAGLWLLQNKIKAYPQIIKTHLEPKAQKRLSQEISTSIKGPYAMMDTSDGLMDAVYKIAKASDVKISINFDKIPYDKEVEEIAKAANKEFKDWVLYGGEDFQIVACISPIELNKLNPNHYSIIGKVEEKTENHFVEVDFNGQIQKITNLEKTYDHFKEKQ